MSSYSLSKFTPRNIPEELIGFDYVDVVEYDSTNMSVSLTYKSGTSVSLGSVMSIPARIITDVSVDANYHLIITFDDLQIIDAGKVFVNYIYGNLDIISGTGVHVGNGVFKPLAAGTGITLSDNNGAINIDSVLGAGGSMGGGFSLNKASTFTESWTGAGAVNGPLAIANSWQTRLLNTTASNALNLTFNPVTNSVTLPIGTYYIEGQGLANRVNGAKLAIRDITNNLTLIEGLTEYSISTAAAAQVTLIARGYVAITSQINIALQQLSETASASSNLGSVSGVTGTSGILSGLKIWKVSDTAVPPTIPSVTLDTVDLAIKNANTTNAGITISGELATFGLTIPTGNKWSGGVLASNGKIYCVPYDATTILVIDTNTNTAVMDTLGATLTGTAKWFGGVLGSDGKIYCIPHSATNILVIDPVTNTATTPTLGANLTGTLKWEGGCIGKDGKIYGIPSSATDILIIDVVAGTATRSAMGATLTGASKWRGGVTSRTGKIICSPRSSTDVLVIDPSTSSATRNTMGLIIPGTGSLYHGMVRGGDDTVYGIMGTQGTTLRVSPEKNLAVESTIGAHLTQGTSKYSGGTIGGDGKIYCAPHVATNILVIDPIKQDSITTTLGLTLSTAAKYSGITAAPNGKLYCIPYAATDVLVISNSTNAALSSSILLSPELNKY